jgi:hypothetical protein
MPYIMEVIEIVDEYEVTFAVKEWLLLNGWNVIAFNPPGAQGTFTIPNPKKATGYRGQTGSLSPDLIAIKNSKYLIVVECKPTFNRSDAEKIVNLFKDRERVRIFLDIVDKVCKANDVSFDKSKCELILAKAHGGELNLQDNLETFHVSVKPEWNSETIKASVKPMDYMQVNYYPSSKETETIVKS